MPTEHSSHFVTLNPLQHVIFSVFINKKAPFK